MWDEEDELGYWDDDEDDVEGYGEEIIGDDWDDIEDELDAAMEGYGGEIIGDEFEDEIGAPWRRRRRRRRRRPRRRRYGKRKALRRVRNRQLRRYPLGLGATVIGAGATAIISANPQLPFRVNRLVVAINAGSTGLLIDNLQVGTVSQFVAAGSVPIDVFAPDAVAVQLKGDTAVPGVNVQITVSNPTGGALTFAGAIIGTVAQ